MAKSKYSDKQVAVFQKFIRAGFDINDVKNPDFNEKQLKELYLGRKAGIDISLYCLPELPAEAMKELRKTAAAGVDLKEIAKTVIQTGKYNRDQTLQILDAAKHGVNFKNMLNPDLDHLQMRQIKLGERYGIDTNVYASPDFSAEQMQRLRLELIVQKVIETIKEFFKKKWEKFLEWVRYQETPPEETEDIREVLSFNPDDSIIERLLSGSAFTIIAGSIFNEISDQILEGEAELENETVIGYKETAERVSEAIDKMIDSIKEEQRKFEEAIGGAQKEQPEPTVKTNSGEMPLGEYREMTAYHHGYDSYADMQKQGISIDENAQLVETEVEAVEESFEPEM